MDLTISPDWDARVCYLAVLLIGCAVAAYQLVTRLDDPLCWERVETWLLFLCYVAVPVALFWFLDRTKVTSDTLLLAAILVGGGYPMILAGKGSLAVPSYISKLWQPFEAWANGIIEKVLQRRKLNPALTAQRKVIAFKGLIVASLIALSVYALFWYDPVQYLAWRLEKPNATPTDQLRTRRDIANALKNQQTRDTMTQTLVTAAELPEMPAARLDDIVALLLEHRQELPGLRTQMIGLLRSNSADIRARAQQLLLFLHKEDGGGKLPAELETWKPSAADTAATIEEHVTMWNEV